MNLYTAANLYIESVPCRKAREDVFEQRCRGVSFGSVSFGGNDRVVRAWEARESGLEGNKSLKVWTDGLLL